MRLSHGHSKAELSFDDPNLVSSVGLVPLLSLAEQAGLSELIADRVSFDGVRTLVRSAGENPAGKITTIVAGMAAGADCIDDLDVVRTGGMSRLFGAVYALAVGQFLREFTHGHGRQLSSVLRAHLINLMAVSTRSGPWS